MPLGDDRYGTFHGTDEVSILSGAAGQKSYQKKIMRRRIAWCAGLTCAAGVLGALIVVALHYVEHGGKASSSSPGPSAHRSMTSQVHGEVPADMLALMDPSVNPCDDFYNYACGGFVKDTVLKPDQLGFAHAWDGVQHNNTARLLPYLETSDNAAGVFYKSCMNLTAIEEIGIAPLKPFIKQVSEIKDLDSLEAVIFWWHKANVVVFYDWSVESNPDKPEESGLYLMQGGITLPSADFYLSRDRSMQLKREGYKKVARRVLTEVCKLWKGCDVEHWPAEGAERAMRVETELATRFASAEEQRTERAQQYTIAQITKLCPALHLRRFINAMAGTYHSQADTIVDKITIMIRNSPYFESMDKYLTKANLDDLKAYLLFRLAFVLGADMNKKMEDMGFELQRVITGQVKKVPRWKKCMHACINALPDDVGKIFVHHFFTTATKQHAEHMLMRLKMAFTQDFKAVDWLQNSTKEAGLQKLKAMFFAVGKPSYWNYYNGVYLDPLKYLWNGLQLSEWYIQKSFRRLTEKVDPRRWGSTSPTETDAFYSDTANGIFVPAGILQKPFFSPEYDAARNFGALGSILGHEITHGFDDQGRKFGPKGTLQNWWSQADSRRFEEKARCIEHFYSSFKISGHHVNGDLTLGEDIADMGGVKISYHALQMYRNNKQDCTAYSCLSGQEQRLFFLAWGQNWCSVERKRAQELQLFTDEHAPNKLRVNGPLMNFEQFAKAYGCPSGSGMAPAHKCLLW